MDHPDTDIKTCGGCLHWKRVPPSAADLAPKIGECRYGPPQITIAIGQVGGGLAPLGQIGQYPQLPATCPACSKHTPRAGD